MGERPDAEGRVNYKYKRISKYMEKPSNGGKGKDPVRRFFATCRSRRANLALPVRKIYKMKKFIKHTKNNDKISTIRKSRIDNEMK